jgi:mannitol operon transcriptional antiterminator
MNWINKKTIRVNVKVENWQEAVTKSGDLLVAAGLVEPRYINAMIDTTKEMGPYCVIAPGIAIPHGRPEFGVLKTGFSAITLTKPVEFGNPDNDPVFLVLALCALDHDSHIKALTSMARAISKKEFLERAKQAVSKDELEVILNQTN